jgi:hypothetical protein
MAEGVGLRSATEMLGLIALVASLGFVGMEIRQNTAAVRSATTQAVSDQTMALTLSMATDEHLPGLVYQLRAGVTEAELAPADYMRLRLVVLAGLRRQENLYLQVQAGILDAASLGNVSFSFYRNAFGRELWAGDRATFAPEFASYWDGVMSAQ